MINEAINTIGLCIIGGKYLLVLLLAAVTALSGSASPELLAFNSD